MSTPIFIQGSIKKQYLVVKVLDTGDGHEIEELVDVCGTPEAAHSTAERTAGASACKVRLYTEAFSPDAITYQRKVEAVPEARPAQVQETV